MKFTINFRKKTAKEKVDMIRPYVEDYIVIRSNTKYESDLYQTINEVVMHNKNDNELFIDFLKNTNCADLILEAIKRCLKVFDTSVENIDRYIFDTYHVWIGCDYIPEKDPF